MCIRNVLELFSMRRREQFTAEKLINLSECSIFDDIYISMQRLRAASEVSVLISSCDTIGQDHLLC